MRPLYPEPVTVTVEPRCPRAATPPSRSDSQPTPRTLAAKHLSPQARQNQRRPQVIVFVVLLISIGYVVVSKAQDSAWRIHEIFGQKMHARTETLTASAHTLLLTPRNLSTYFCISKPHSLNQHHLWEMFPPIPQEKLQGHNSRNSPQFRKQWKRLKLFHQISESFSSNDWFVSDNGSDTSDCRTEGTPCRSLQAVLDRMSDGAHVYITSPTLSLPDSSSIRSSLSYTLSGIRNKTVTVTSKLVCVGWGRPPLPRTTNEFVCPNLVIVLLTNFKFSHRTQ